MTARAQAVLLPLALPTIDAVCAAALATNALPVPVHTLATDRIHEVVIWQEGEWIGSVFRWPRGEGLGARSSLGNVHVGP